MKPLVSIISPCYNGERYLERFLCSVLNQTYERIELILIDDGSVDGSRDIILSYQKPLEEKGYLFHYVYQQNSGQAAALNRGLKIFSGRYVTWPDSDDVLYPESIEKKVRFLEQNTDCGGVISWGAIVPEEQPEKKRGMLRFHHREEKENIFERLIFEDKVYFAPAGYMVRSSCLEAAIPQKEIYISKCGQNWQILLPIAQKYPFGFIDEALFDYVVRNNSHSRKEKSYEENIKKTFIHEDCLQNTLNRIAMESGDRKRLYERISLKYLRKRMDIAYQHKKKRDLEDCYLKLKAVSAVNHADRALYTRAHFRLYDLVYKAGVLAACWGRKVVWYVKNNR